MSVHILGAAGSDANDPVGYLPGQVAATAVHQVGSESRQYTDNMMAMMEKTLRRCAAPRSDIPHAIVKKDNKYRGKRYKLWKSRETGLWLWVWPERGFVHIERDDGEYKKWTRRDALKIVHALGEQIKYIKWADERKATTDAYSILVEVCKEARNQGDPTVMTDAEQRSLRESVACAMLPGYGPIKEKKVTFVGQNIVQGAS